MAWTRVANTLNSQNQIYSLVTHDGELYGGTSPNGYLFKWNGADSWIKMAHTSGSQYLILSLISYGGSLYGGTGSGGRLFRFTGTAWNQVADYLNQSLIWCLCEHGGELYAGTGPNGKLYKWNGIDSWIEVAGQYNPPFNTHIYSLISFYGCLYGVTQGAKLLRWNDVDAWEEVGTATGESAIESVIRHNNKIYCGTYSHAKLFEWDGINTLNQVAPQVFFNTTIQCLISHSLTNKIYGGTSAYGNLLEWNDIDNWTRKCSRLYSQNDILSLIEFNNKIYGGTGGSGMLFEYIPVLPPEKAINPAPMDTEIDVITDLAKFEWEYP